MLYAALGSWLTYVIGRPLVRVNFDLQRYNADFRYRMVRVRENAESIALYGGEPDEERRLGGAFGRIYDNWWDYMQLQQAPDLASPSFYGQAADIFPLVVASPRYFAGQIPLGVLTQTASAFGQVQGSLSWFVDVCTTLADWKATVDRLTTFGESHASARSAKPRPTPAASDRRPCRRPIWRSTTSTVAAARRPGAAGECRPRRSDPGERLVLQGPSGSGKTTLFRVLAGLWPFGRGRIRMPEGRPRPVPAAEALHPGRHAARRRCATPDPVADAHDDASAARRSRRASSTTSPTAWTRTRNWSLVLSRRRAAATVASPAPCCPAGLAVPRRGDLRARRGDRRRHSTGCCAERLPDATVVSIAHKPSVARFHEARLRIDPGGAASCRSRSRRQPSPPDGCRRKVTGGARGAGRDAQGERNCNARMRRGGRRPRLARAGARQSNDGHGQGLPWARLPSDFSSGSPFPRRSPCRSCLLA